MAPLSGGGSKMLPARHTADAAAVAAYTIQTQQRAIPQRDRFAGV